MQDYEGGKAEKEAELQTCPEEVTRYEQRGRCTFQVGRIV